MRWRFVDPTNRREALERFAVTARIDSWWREFHDRADEIAAVFSRKAILDLPAWMDLHLGAIHPSLCWEFGPAVLAEGHRLVITPESAHHLRPLVRAILERAPVLEGWEFYEYRLPEDLESTRSAVEGRSDFDISGLKFRASCGDQLRIDLKYASPGIADSEDPSALNAAFVTTESLLGEQCLNTWIGAIEITPMRREKGLKSLRGGERKQPPHFLALDRLKEIVEALIGSMREQLPPRPHCEWVEGAEWTMWQLKPEEAEDYVAKGISSSASRPTRACGSRRIAVVFFSRSDSAVVGRRSVMSSSTARRAWARKVLPTSRKSRMRWTPP
jgi:hypothetical protein